MPTYVIANVRVTDPELYREYAAGTPASIARFGGRFLVRGGAAEVREGSWSPHRVVVIEFPDGDAARAWYESDEYRALLEIRQRAAETELVFVEGVAS
jgi:uncharacterized protein (DUF1330 family)